MYPRARLTALTQINVATQPQVHGRPWYTHPVRRAGDQLNRSAAPGKLCRRCGNSAQGKRRHGLYGRSRQIWRDSNHGLGHRGLSRWRADRAADGMAGLQYRAISEFRAASPAAHLRGDLCFWGECTTGDQLLRGPAHDARITVGRQSRLVRVLGLPAVHRHGGNRLRSGHHPEPRIRRT
jgi:hypothetical protein